MFRKNSKVSVSPIKKEITSSSLKKLNLTTNKKETLYTIPTSSERYSIKNQTIKNIFDKSRLSNNSHNHKMIKIPKRKIDNYFKDRKRLFSLLDINDKITNSKGPNMPSQYLRGNLDKLLETSYPSHRLFKINDEYENKNQGDYSTGNTLENNADKNPIQVLFKAFSDNKLNIKDHPKIKSISCEDIFANPNMKNKYKYKNISLNLIRAKNIASDVFNTKCINEENEYRLKGEDYRDFQKSDIFSLRNNNEQLFNFKDNYYNSTRESKSEWHPKITIPTLLNYSSAEFDIITNRIPSIPKSKQGINTECNKQGIMFNPVNRQKSLSQFIDITRTGNPNSNKSYAQYYSDNIKPFNRLKNICSNFIDIHKNYSMLCELPFVKKK